MEARRERQQREQFREVYYEQVRAGGVQDCVAGSNGMDCLTGLTGAAISCQAFCLVSSHQLNLPPPLVQGVSYGKPAACMIFDLAALLGQETSHMLW